MLQSHMHAAPEHALLLSSSSAAVSPLVGCKSSSKGGHYDLRIVCAARQKAAGGATAHRPIVATHKAGVWRLLNLEVSADRDPGKDDYSVSRPLLEAIANLLACPVDSLPSSVFKVVRKSFDARKVVNKKIKDLRFVYTVDLHIEELQAASSTASKVSQFLKNRPGKLEFISGHTDRADVSALVSRCKAASSVSMTEKTENAQDNGLGATVAHYRNAKVTVVGSGPAGLFASLVLAESGAKVTLLERGQSVESRGRDIGQLMVRRFFRPDSNFCYGEGGAGTWSDGKLTTGIGRNKDTVKAVFESLVKFGAPSTILLDGKPHIGTDRLIHILRKMRSYLQSLGPRFNIGDHDGRALKKSLNHGGHHRGKDKDRQLVIGNNLTRPNKKREEIGSMKILELLVLLLAAESWISSQEWKKVVQDPLDAQVTDTITWTSLVAGLKACGGVGALKRGQVMHAEISKRGLLEKDVIANATISMYSKWGQISGKDSTKLRTRDMNSCDVVSPADFQEGGKQCFWERTEATLRELQEAGHSPSFKAWNTLTSTVAICGEYDNVQFAVVELIAEGEKPTEWNCTAMM
ncbi:hypothetical protein L7F22_015894 [Adiantum nelumboides]|nr:hypothetical protein [Adiantum nelumboides]